MGGGTADVVQQMLGEAAAELDPAAIAEVDELIADIRKSGGTEK